MSEPTARVTIESDGNVTVYDDVPVSLLYGTTQRLERFRGVATPEPEPPTPEAPVTEAPEGESLSDA